jgi:epoxide hydrolase-like predicted phosphatase
MNKTAIIFDFGGVLGSDANFWTSDEEFMDYTGLSNEELEQLFWQHWDDLKVGNEDLEVVFAEIKKQSKEAVTIQKLREICLQKLRIDAAVLDIIDELSKTYKLYMLANESLEGMATKTKKFHLNKYFLKIFNSASLQLYKPDPKVFEKVLRTMKVEPHEVIFIDDQEKNVLAAQKLGITSVLFKDASTLKQDLYQIFTSPVL